MISNGLLIRLEATAGRDTDLQRFLEAAAPMVRDEPATTAWFAVKFGNGHYGIFSAFLNEEGRAYHLAGALAAALRVKGQDLLAKDPVIEKATVLASKLPALHAPPQEITRGLLLTFRPKQGHEAQVENFLRGAKGIVDAEAGTASWFALHLASGDYGIFDVFPDNAARLAHLAGHVPRELAKHALSLLGGVPDMDMLEVVAVNFAERETLVGLGVD